MLAQLLCETVVCSCHRLPHKMRLELGEVDCNLFLGFLVPLRPQHILQRQAPTQQFHVLSQLLGLQLSQQRVYLLVELLAELVLCLRLDHLLHLTPEPLKHFFRVFI